MRVQAKKHKKDWFSRGQESCVECHDELAEMTLLVNASTELLDIEEVHLRYASWLVMFVGSPLLLPDSALGAQDRRLQGRSTARFQADM